MIKLIETIVNSNINGIAVIPGLIWVIWVLVGQVVETIEIFKEV